jgi:3-hexulose-6-phosphate synthase
LRFRPKNIELQLALDVNQIEAALYFAEEAYPYVDRIEIGSPLLFLEGALTSIQALRQRYPSAKLIADCKIMDRGGQITRACIEAGADGVIAQAAAPRDTLESVCRVAGEYQAEVMLDSLGISELEDLMSRIDSLPASHLIVHRGKDEQAAGAGPPVEAVRAASGKSSLPSLAIAGGIDTDSITRCAETSVDVIIVGEAIISSQSPRATAAKLRRLCDLVRSPV